MKIDYITRWGGRSGWWADGARLDRRNQGDKWKQQRITDKKGWIEPHYQFQNIKTVNKKISKLTFIFRTSHFQRLNLCGNGKVKWHTITQNCFMPAILLEVDDNNVKEFSCDITEDNRNVTLYTKLEFCFQHACDNRKSLYYKEVET